MINENEYIEEMDNAQKAVEAAEVIYNNALNILDEANRADFKFNDIVYYQGSKAKIETIDISNVSGPWTIIFEDMTKHYNIESDSLKRISQEDYLLALTSFETARSNLINAKELLDEITATMASKRAILRNIMKTEAAITARANAIREAREKELQKAAAIFYSS